MKTEGIGANIYLKISGDTVVVPIKDELEEFFMDNPELFRKILLSALKKKRRKLLDEIRRHQESAKEVKLMRKVAEAIINSNVVNEALKDVHGKERRRIKRIIKNSWVFRADTYNTYWIEQYTKELNRVRAAIEILEKNPVADLELIYGD